MSQLGEGKKRKNVYLPLGPRGKVPIGKERKEAYSNN
jgi:hypothetical protein